MSEYPKYWKGAFNRNLGMAVFKQESASSSSQMMAHIVLHEKEAGELADALIATLTRSESPVEKAAGEMYKALTAAQFGFNHKRCSLCGGWNMGPNGETDGVHTKDCVIAKALAAYDAVKEGK